MKVYVAGGFKFKAEVRAVQDVLRHENHTITHDWTTFEHDDVGRTHAECARYSALDMAGVRTADAVVVVIVDPAHPHRGTLAEIGAAIALKKQIIVLDCVDCGSGEHERLWQTPFLHDDQVTRVESLADVCRLLCAGGGG